MYTYTEASINRRLIKKGWSFSGPQRKRKPREDTTYLLFFVGSFVVRFSMLMTSFQSVFWSVFVFPSRIFSSLDIRLFTYAFSCSRVRLTVFCLFWLSFQLSCAFYSTRFTPFTSCFLWSLCLFLSRLFSLKTLSPRT